MLIDSAPSTLSLCTEVQSLSEEKRGVKPEDQSFLNPRVRFRTGQHPHRPPYHGVEFGVGCEQGSPRSCKVYLVGHPNSTTPLRDPSRPLRFHPVDKDALWVYQRRAFVEFGGRAHHMANNLVEASIVCPRDEIEVVRSIDSS